MLRDLRFVDPDAAYWLLVVPIAWCCWLLHRWHRERRRRAAGIGPAIARLAPLTARRRDAAVIGLVTLTFVALVAAAARPQAVVSAPQYDSFDLIILLDRSASMLAADVKPSRLGRASLEIQNFLRDKPETIDRVALVTFANTALVSSHLTRDRDILFFFLDWIKNDPYPYYGTDMGLALESALNVAKAEGTGRRKVIVMLSDGEDHGERFTSALDDVRRSAIPVYVIGIGSDAAVSIPAPRGSMYATLRDDTGHELRTTFTEDALRRVAATTGGSYFRSTSGLELVTTLTDVARRERKATQFREEYRDVDGYALAAAAITLTGLLILL